MGGPVLDPSDLDRRMFMWMLFGIAAPASLMLWALALYLIMSLFGLVGGGNG